MAKYTVQYEVNGFVDVEVEANSVNDALLLPRPDVFEIDETEWNWTPKIVYTEKGERVYG